MHSEVDRHGVWYTPGSDIDTSIPLTALAKAQGGMYHIGILSHFTRRRHRDDVSTDRRFDFSVGSIHPDIVTSTYTLQIDQNQCSMDRSSSHLPTPLPMQ